VLGDPVQLQQVLINLILNAMDAVAGLPPERRIVTLALEVDADRIVVGVHDRGPGIDPKHLPQIFESFFSTKQKGMGLGLSIARTIVEAHGGTVAALRGTGDGAVFRVELPRAAAAASPPPTPP
jgi:C4-dicarboxylate-specific signal transduction histidine kinase